GREARSQKNSTEPHLFRRGTLPASSARLAPLPNAFGLRARPKTSVRRRVTLWFRRERCTRGRDLRLAAAQAVEGYVAPRDASPAARASPCGLPMRQAVILKDDRQLGNSLRKHFARYADALVEAQISQY